jgi:uncharacterized protein (DUF1778 family)
MVAHTGATMDNKDELVRIVFEAKAEHRKLLRQVAANREKEMRELLIEAILRMAREDGLLKDEVTVA